MTTDVILTGVGYPTVDPQRAGPGTLVRCGDVSLQFDAGRATTMRMAAAGVRPPQLTAFFITHHHSDHLTGMSDLVLTRWIGSGYRGDHPLTVVAPAGPSARFASRVLDVWHDDVVVRLESVGSGAAPRMDVRPFDPETHPAVVWTHRDVRVSSFLVRHHPVVPSVGYRVETPDGVVVISGDTCVCPEIEEASRGADVLVHEAMRAMFRERQPDNPLVLYHADTVELGAQAARVGVPVLILTHLIPMVRDEGDRTSFGNEVRRGGFEGELVVGEDLTTWTLQ